MLHPTSKLLLVLASVIFLAIPSILPVTGEDETMAGSPSRTYVEESESNDNWAAADLLPSTAGSTYDLHGNMTSSDFDYFYFNLNGGAGPVDQVTIVPKWVGTSSTNQVFVAWIWSFYPTNSLAHSPSDEMSTAVGIWTEQSFSWWSTLSFRASYSGIYGMIVRPASTLTGTLEYNMTITISSVTPTDANNDQGSSMELTGLSQVVSTTLNTDLDQWDWFHFNAPNPIHPTTLDLPITLANYNPDSNDGIYDWSVEVIVDIFYNSRVNQGTFNKQTVSISPSQFFQKAGSIASPGNIKVTRNCTEMYVSMRILTHGLDTNGNRQYGDYTGVTNYDARFNIIPEIPNNRPYLKNKAVTPTGGRSSDLFRFSVDYYDANNETPAAIWLWKDGKEFRELSPIQGGSNMDHALGVEYYIEIPGNLLGKDQAHVMNFSATDGEDWAINFPEALETFTVKVDDNLPPSSSVGQVYLVEMEEDDVTLELPLDTLFTDPDPTTSFSFEVKDPHGEWGPLYRDDMITASIKDPQTAEDPTLLLLTPAPNVYGSFFVTVNATDDGSFVKFAELTIQIDVEEVNDIPEIHRIGKSSVDEQDTYIRFPNEEQDSKVNLDVIASDLDEGDILTYHWDFEESLSNPIPGVNYFLNFTSGESWFIPQDSDYPQVDLVLTVKDSNGGEVSMPVIVDVGNVNDPPVLSVPESKSTIEGEFLYINPFAYDPDLDTGDQLMFGYDLGELALVTPANAISFDIQTGRLVIEAVKEEMNGEWEITITVNDLALQSDSGTCSVVIQNVNDAPVSNTVYPDAVDGNLTVIFSTAEALDEDGDSLTYIWDFGDGTPAVQDVDLKYIEHDYANEGSYTISMVVFDGKSYSKEQTVLLSLVGPEPDPDLDNDDLPDIWEIRFGFDPTNPLDAGEDPDEDGLTNLEEYNLNMKYGWSLNPMNPDSDEDGWKDGKEVRGAYDPMDATDHPVSKYDGYPLMIYIIAFLILFLAIILAIVFVVLRRRNRPQAIASAAYGTPVDYPPATLPEQQYPAVQSGPLPEALPSAGIDETAYQDQYSQDPGAQAWPDQQEQMATPDQQPFQNEPAPVYQQPILEEAPAQDIYQQPPEVGLPPVQEDPLQHLMAEDPGVQDSYQQPPMEETPQKEVPDMMSVREPMVEKSLEDPSASGVEQGTPVEEQPVEEAPVSSIPKPPSPPKI